MFITLSATVRTECIHHIDPTITVVSETRCALIKCTPTWNVDIWAVMALSDVDQLQKRIRTVRGQFGIVAMLALGQGNAMLV